MLRATQIVMALFAILLSGLALTAVVVWRDRKTIFGDRDDDGP